MPIRCSNDGFIEGKLGTGAAKYPQFGQKQSKTPHDWSNRRTKRKEDIVHDIHEVDPHPFRGATWADGQKTDEKG